MMGCCICKLSLHTRGMFGDRLCEVSVGLQYTIFKCFAPALSPPADSMRHMQRGHWRACTWFTFDCTSDGPTLIASSALLSFSNLAMLKAVFTLSVDHIKHSHVEDKLYYAVTPKVAEPAAVACS
jgi:hypothetical protein